MKILKYQKLCHRGRFIYNGVYTSQTKGLCGLSSFQNKIQSNLNTSKPPGTCIPKPSDIMYSSCRQFGSFHNSKLLVASNLSYFDQKRHKSVDQFYSDNFNAENNYIVEFVENFFTSVHDWSGLPWWASIGMTSLMYGLCLRLPINIYVLKLHVRLESLKPVMDAKAQNIRKEIRFLATANKLTQAECEKIFKRRIHEAKRELYLDYNCHPRKADVLNLAFFPVWIFSSISIGNLARPDPTFKGELIGDTVKCPDLLTGGTLWFPNLCETDFLLPVFILLQNLFNVFLMSIQNQDAPKMRRRMNGAFGAFAFVFFFIASSCPSALCVFWFTSGFTSLFLMNIMKFPKVKRLFGIGHLPSESDTPFKDLVPKFKRRYFQDL